MSQPEFIEEELRQLEAEMERITVDDVLHPDDGHAAEPRRAQGGAGAPARPRPPAPDWEQVRQAIEGARALLPLLERATPTSSARCATPCRGCS